MSDNLVSLDKFRVLRKEADDADDMEWIELVCQNLEGIKEKVASKQTSALVVMELEEEVSSYKLHLLGLAEYDVFTIVGLLENMKLQILASFDEE